MTLDAVLAEFFTSPRAACAAQTTCRPPAPTYRDPETGGHYCLGCLELSTEELPEMPPDPAITEMAREIIANIKPKTKRKHAPCKQLKPRPQS